MASAEAAPLSGQLVLPSLSGWYGPTEPGSPVYSMDGSRPRRLETLPLLIGEWPPKTGEGPYGPLSARPAHVLAGILGVTYETFLCLFERANLLKYWVSERPPRIASLRVMAGHLSDPPPGAPVIMLGRRVARAFEFKHEFYDWAQVGIKSSTPCVVVPHPSGKNLMYNDAAERERVGDALRKALLFHGKVFRVGEYPHGNGSLVMMQRGDVWGEAKRRLKHKAKDGEE